MSNKVEERFFEKVSLKFDLKTVQPIDVQGKVLEEYYVESYGIRSKVKIVESVDGVGYYIVEEDKVSPEEIKAFSMLAGLMTAEEVAGISDRAEYIERMKKAVREKRFLVGSGLSDEQVDRVVKYVAREVLGYSVLDPLMYDENVSDIVCPSYVRGVVVKHRNYPDLGWLDTNIKMSRSDLDVFVQKLAGKFGKELSVMMPKVEVMSEDGSRFMMTFRSEISLPSSTFAIRKFPKKSWSIARLVELKMLTPEIAAYLWHLVEKKKFIIISGPMGSGKTTLLTALLSLINPVNMVCTCEDVPEIILPPQIKWYRLVSRKGSVFGVRESEVSLFDTVLLSLRTGADYVIVGEVRGVEIQALVQAAGAGMGCMTTFHADSMGSLVARMKGKPLSVDESFLMTIGSVVFVGNLPVGVERNLRRRVVSVEESSYLRGEFTSDKIFSFNPKDDVFEPTDLEEVFKNSQRLKEIANFTKEDVVSELDAKRKIVLECVKNRFYTAEEMASYLIKLSRG